MERSAVSVTAPIYIWGIELQETQNISEKHSEEASPSISKAEPNQQRTAKSKKCGGKLRGPTAVVGDPVQVT